MKNVFVLSGANMHHENNSKFQIGIFDTYKKAVKAAKEHAHANGDVFSNNDNEGIEKGQTQGREQNYMIEPVELNTYSL